MGCGVESACSRATVDDDEHYASKDCIVTAWDGRNNLSGFRETAELLQPRGLPLAAAHEIYGRTAQPLRDQHNTRKADQRAGRQIREHAFGESR